MYRSLENMLRRRWHAFLIAVALSAPAWPVAAVETLTPQQCIEEALNNNPDLAALEARTAQALDAAVEADAERWPEISIGGATQHATDPGRVRPATKNNEIGVYSRDIWRADVSLEWTVYSGGQVSAAREARALLARAADKDLGFFRQQLAARVAQVYFTLVAQDTLVAANEKSLESLRLQESRISRLLAEGKAAEVDRMRVQVRAAGVEQRLIESRSRMDTLRATLNLFMNRPLADEWSHEGAFEAIFAEVSSDPQVEFPVQRGDVEAARLREQASAENFAEVHAAFRPQLKLLALWGPRADWDGRENYESGYLGLAVRWAVWDGGRRSARLSSARHEISAASAQAVSLSNRQELEVITARRDLQAARDRLDVSRIATSTARESLRIEKRKYTEGRGVIIDVLDAEAAALEAESLYRGAQADVLVSLVALDLALGRILSSQASCSCLRGSVAGTTSP